MRRILCVLFLLVNGLCFAQNKNAANNEIKTLPQLKAAYGIDLSVYVYQRSLDQYADDLKGLAKSIIGFGFTDVYLSFNTNNMTKQKDYANNLRTLIGALSSKGVRVHALAFTEINAVGEEQDQTLAAFKKYQEFSPAKERFVGINFDIEPHIMRQSRAGWKKVSDKYNVNHINWKSDKGYGKDGANSQVMQYVLDRIDEIAKKTEGKNYTYSQAIGHFFEDKYQEGNLSVGGVNDFLKTCDNIVIMNYVDNTERLIKFSMKELDSASKPRSVEIAVKTSDNGVGDLSTSYADEGWEKMMESLVALCEAAKPYPTFKGIGFFEYKSMEELAKLKNAPLPSTLNKR